MRLRPLLPALLLAAFLLPSGCSNNSDRVTGNERLIRGAGGLGSTLVETTVPDRDTYVTPGTANYGSVLLIGQDSRFEARAYFKFLKINLPSTDFTGVVMGDPWFELPPVPLNGDAGDRTYSLYEVSALADSGTIAWPGPAQGALLATGFYEFTGPLVLRLAPGSASLIQQWTAPEPDSLPTFMIRSTTAEGIAGFASKSMRLRIPYTHTVGNTVVADTVNTTVPFDLYLHPPLTPAPTGSDTSLVLGGPYEASVAIRAPVPAVSPGSSINDLRLVFGVLDTIPGYRLQSDTLGVTLAIQIYRVTGDWAENVTNRSEVPTDANPAALVLRRFAVGDTLSVPLPADLARGWTTTNNGVLLSVRTANLKPGLRLGSRESAVVPLMRVGTTTAPPGRF